MLHQLQTVSMSMGWYIVQHYYLSTVKIILSVLSLNSCSDWEQMTVDRVEVEITQF